MESSRLATDLIDAERRLDLKLTELVYGEDANQKSLQPDRDQSLADYLVQALSNVDGRPTPAQRRKAVRKAERELAKAVNSFFTQASSHRARFDNINAKMAVPHLALKASAGLGKTRQVIAAAIEHAGRSRLRTLYLLPNHKMIEQERVKVPGAKVLQGRERPGQCLRPAVVRRAIEVGLSIKDNVCRPCTRQAECPYIQNVRAISNDTSGGVVFGTHQQLAFLRGDLKFDIVVVDEGCVASLMVSKTLHPDRFDAATERYPRIADFLGPILDAVRTKDGKILSALRASGFVKSADFNAALALLDELIECEAPTIDMAADDAEIVEKLGQTLLSDFKKLAALVAQLSREIGLDREASNGVVYRPNERVSVDGIIETQNRLEVHFRRQLAISEETPVLVIDGSLNPALIRRIWPTMECRIINAPRNAVVLQSTSAKFDERSLLSESENLESSYVRQISAFVRELGAKRPLVVTYKDVLGKVRRPGDLGPGCDVAYFGALRGRNDWEDCDAAIIAGRLQPEPRKIERQVRCLWNDDAVQVFESRPETTATKLKGTERVLPDGELYQVDTEMYPDPRYQAVLEMIREEEIGQAIDRLRLVHAKAPKLVVLLMKVDAGISVDLALPWPDLRGRMVKVVRAMCGRSIIRKNENLLLKDLSRESWKHSDKFTADLNELCRKSSKSTQMGFRKLFPFFHEVEYRLQRNGKWDRGRNSRAWIHSSICDVATAVRDRYQAEGVSVTDLEIAR